MSVRNLIVGEFGKNLLFNAGVDISDATAFTVEFTKPDGTVLTETVTLGDVDVTGKDQDCADVTFLANQYTIFTIPDADFLDAAGCWAYRAINPQPSGTVPGEAGSFTVIE